jgi:hypothetical protein
VILVDELPRPGRRRGGRGARGSGRHRAGGSTRRGAGCREWSRRDGLVGGAGRSGPYRRRTRARTIAAAVSPGRRRERCGREPRSSSPGRAFSPVVAHPFVRVTRLSRPAVDDHLVHQQLPTGAMWALNTLTTAARVLECQQRHPPPQQHVGIAGPVGQEPRVMWAKPIARAKSMRTSATRIRGEWRLRRSGPR